MEARLHFCFSFGEEAAKAFFDCSEQQVFSPDKFQCLRVIKGGQDSFLRLSGLISVIDSLRDTQDLIRLVGLNEYVYPGGFPAFLRGKMMANFQIWGDLQENNLRFHQLLSRSWT